MGASRLAGRLQRALWLVASLAMAAAGSIGLAHRVVHLGLPGAAHGALASAAHVHHSHHQAGSVTVVEARAFDQHEDGSAECRLLDQLLHLDTLLLAGWVAPPPPASQAPVLPPASRPSSGAAHGYLARGPPAA